MCKDLLKKFLRIANFLIFIFNLNKFSEGKNMISKVSLGSTYKVQYNSNDKNANFEKFSAFGDYPYTEGSLMTLKDKFKRDNYFAERILIVPDSQDKDVEAYCKRYGIEFVKHTNDELLNPQNVISRIENAPRGYTKVNLDVEEFEKLLNRTKESNVKGCEEDYNKYFKQEMDFMLKSGDKIPATALFIDSNLYGDFDRFVNLYGAKNVKPTIDFAQISPNHHEHCMYFALRDLGMKKVPVYVNENSYKVGHKLGLF